MFLLRIRISRLQEPCQKYFKEMLGPVPPRLAEFPDRDYAHPNLDGSTMPKRLVNLVFKVGSSFESFIVSECRPLGRVAYAGVDTPLFALFLRGHTH